MKLSEILHLTKSQVDSQAGVEQSLAYESASIANINRQIRSLIPGQQIKGEIIAINGSEVKVKLADDMVISARLDREMNLEVAKLITFEVRNNGSVLSLSPLFENTATNSYVIRALDMAGLPVNGSSVEMTERLMSAGMPVDRESLQNVYKDVINFPEASIANVVMLHQMQMPVTKENLSQLINYQNLTHQITLGMTDALGELHVAFGDMMAAGQFDMANQMYQELLQVLTEDIIVIDGQQVVGEEVETAPLINTFNKPISGLETSLNVVLDEEGLGQFKELLQVLSGLEADVAQGSSEGLNTDASKGPITELLGRITEKSTTVEDVLKVLAQETAGVSLEKSVALSTLFNSKEYQQLLKAELLNKWTLSPEDIGDKKKVAEVYERLSRQLEGIKAILNTGGEQTTRAASSVSELQNNVNFMNQLNQIYAFVQLPLRLQNGEKSGDLYVYTSKDSFASRDGGVSALLHLDMEYLGSVDIYVALSGENVNTKFYLEDDELLDFIEGHMSTLDERLQKRGYHMEYEMIQKHAKNEVVERSTNQAIDALLQTVETGECLAHYAFDARA